MPAPLLDLHGVAAFRGVHYDTARKGWGGWVRRDAFPAPVTLDPLRWNGASLTAWAEAREAANRAALLQRPTDADAPANENQPDRPPTRRIDRERNAVRLLMQSPQAAPRAVGANKGA